jgi:hypothetical protein
MAFDPSIIMGYRGMGELPNPMNQLAQVSQIQAAQQQGQMNQMKIEEMLAERKEIDSMAAVLKDKGYTPRSYLEMMVSSRNPERQKIGAEGLFRLKRQADFQSQFGPALGKMFGEPTAAPAETPAAGTFAADTAARRTAMAPAAPVNAMAPASVNAMAPATAAARQPASINQMEQMAMQLGQYEDVPGAKTVANLLEKKLEAARKITSGAPGHVLYQNGVAISTVPTELDDLITKANDPLTSPAAKAIYEQRIKKLSTHTPGTSVYMPPQEKAFESELGKGQAEGLIKGKAAAQDAASIIDTVKTGRDIMKSGMITGAGADFLVNLNQGLKTAGIDMGYGDAAANSQAFTANMASNVGKLIKQFGAGTGLSDADREFAKDMAGGRISLDTKAINRILDINERAARNSITRHNKDVKGIKTNIPLEVEMPVAAPSAPVVSAPSSAIDYLRANPSMKSAFDAKYGAGAADRVLRGQ